MLVKKLLESSCEDLPYDANSAGHGLINGVRALLRPLANASNL